MTQAETFPEARRIAVGLLGPPTYANVSKISLQLSQPLNSGKQPVPIAQASIGRAQKDQGRHHVAAVYLLQHTMILNRDSKFD